MFLQEEELSQELSQKKKGMTERRKDREGEEITFAELQTLQIYKRKMN